MLRSACPAAGPFRGCPLLLETGLEALLAKRCLMITGKGGVGRSSISSALALAARSHGKRVLLTEVAEDGDDYSPLAGHFHRHRLPHAPEQIAPGIQGAALLPRTGQEMFLRTVLRGPLARAAMSSETIRRLLNAGPSFREMGLYFQLLSYLRATLPDGTPEHELVIVDMPATGHTLSLTGLPELLLQLVTRGPIADTLREGVAFLSDPAKAAACIVTLPEMLPVSECLELLDGLEKTKVPIGAIILNRAPQDPFTPAERKALIPIVAGRALYGAEGFRRVELCRAAALRLKDATKYRLMALPEAVLPDRELIAYLAGVLDRNETLESLLGTRIAT